MVVDIDYFKIINDIYGYDIGDEVFIYIICLMKEVVRIIDVVVRIGGEEFLVLFFYVMLS